MRILIAEDDEGCRTIINRFLAPLGHCETCTDGAQAVEAVERSLAEKQPFDLICLDIHMPGMDGHSAAGRIRDIEFRHGADSVERRSKIMIITAMGDTDNVTNAFDADCDAFIAKPFSHDRLMEQLYLMGLTDTPGAPGKTGAAAPEHPA